MSYSEQEKVRREKLKKIIALGINPYPPELFPVSHLSTMIKENFESNKKVSITNFFSNVEPEITFANTKALSNSSVAAAVFKGGVGIQDGLQVDGNVTTVSYTHLRAHET